MTDVQDLLPGIARLRRGAAGGAGDLGQDRVADLLVGLGDQGRADGARRIAGAEGDEAATPAHRHRRCRQEIAQHVEDVLQVVFQAELAEHEGDDRITVLGRQPAGPADAGIVGAVARQRHGHAAFAERHLDEARPLGAVLGLGHGVAHIEGGMRPGRLGEVFDRRRDLLVAFDQQDVAGLQRAAQRLRVGGRIGFVAGGFVLQPGRQPATEPVQQRFCGRRHRSPVATTAVRAARVRCRLTAQVPGSR
jgi:hypothetical protein